MTVSIRHVYCSLEHFAFETLLVSTRHSGEERGFRQNPRHVVARGTFVQRSSSYTFSKVKCSSEIALRTTNRALPARAPWPKPRQRVHAGVFSGFPEQQSSTTLRSRTFGRQKAEGMAAMLCPPARHALPLSSTPGSTIPPGTPSLETHGRFSALRTQKPCLSLRTAARPEKVGHHPEHPVAPGRTWPHPATSGGADGEKKKMHHALACYKMVLKALTS